MTLKEECGIFGVYNDPDAAAHTILGLHSLQHRGEESTGIVSFDGEHFQIQKGMGLVSDNFNTQEAVDNLKGIAAIGHNRYSTTGDSESRNIQPLFAHYAFGGMAIAHNGNLTNAQSLREDLAKQGSIFQSSTDTEVFIHLIANSKKPDLIDRLIDAMKTVKGAYSLIAMTNKRIIGARDPHGVRPLCIGKLGDSYMLASESVAFDVNDAEFIRDVEPGEIVILDKDGISSRKPFNEKSHFCIFEYVYFAKPDSKVMGKSIYETRKNIGKILAIEDEVEDVDLVVPIPDSGVPAAIGYSHASGIPYDMGIIRNHYVGRTFIQPTQKIRNLKVKLKHGPSVETIKDKKIILVDDSIVRGTTAKKIVDMLWNAGVKEIHLRVAAPPSIGPCHYGIDTPNKEQLIANSSDIEQIKDYLNVTSLKYISINGLYEAVTGSTEKDGYCDACFTNNYPISIEPENKIINFSLLKDFADRKLKRK